MDWATLLKDYPVIVGALIATIPILISNVIQIILHVVDIRQKNREAKIQALEKSWGSDIDKAMDLLSRLIIVLSEYANFDFKAGILREQKNKGALSDDEYLKQLNLHIDLLTAQTQEI